MNQVQKNARRIHHTGTTYIIFVNHKVKKPICTCGSNTNMTSPTSGDTKHDKGIQNLTGDTESDSLTCHILYPHTLFEGYII